MKLTNKQFDFVQKAYSILGKAEISRQDILVLRANHGLPNPIWFTHDPKYRIGRGLYRLPIEVLSGGAPVFSPVSNETSKVSIPKPEKYTETVQPVITSELVKTVSQEIDSISIRSAADIKKGNFIPQKFPTFVPFGDYADIKRVIESNSFFPVFIAGHKGLGKTIGVEQACYEAGRDYFRVPITIETDEDDLLGGFRLVDGETVWFYGPASIAMLVGGILNLDEVDKASNKIMCLQPILEGRGIYLKKINKYITPAPGFNVFATANTKGKGSEDGKYITSQILDDAFLGRFALMIEQDFPSSTIERKILEKNAKLLNLDSNDTFIQRLVEWADILKKTFAAGGVEECIDPRSLVYVLKSYAIFGGDRIKAVRGFCNKFDDVTKGSFLQAYEALDATVGTTVPPVPEPGT